MSDLNELAREVVSLGEEAQELDTDLQSLSAQALAKRIIDTLPEKEAAAISAACHLAAARGEERPSVKVARACIDLAGADPKSVMPYFGYVPMAGRSDCWVNVEKGAQGVGVVSRASSLGLYVFRSLGGRLHANLITD